MSSKKLQKEKRQIPKNINRVFSEKFKKEKIKQLTQNYRLFGSR